MEDQPLENWRPVAAKIVPAPAVTARYPPPALVIAALCGLALCDVSRADSYWAIAARTAGVDESVLYGMAVWESGRLQDGNVTPWPWTLRWEGGSNYYDSREAALIALEALLAAGYTNIDVGLMQVNWRYHAERLAASDPAAMLDPAENLRMGAVILREALRESGGDITRAVGRYHTPHGARARWYAAGVLALAGRLEEEGIR
jgi:soluble lytic murein transglycosylase-like protein